MPLKPLAASFFIFFLRVKQLVLISWLDAFTFSLFLSNRVFKKITFEDKTCNFIILPGVLCHFALFNATWISSSL